jgi:hypothetical protein
MSIDERNENNWIIMSSQFMSNKTGSVTLSLPELNLKKQNYWLFHFNDKYKKSNGNDLLNGRDHDLRKKIYLILMIKTVN